MLCFRDSDLPSMLPVKGPSTTRSTSTASSVLALGCTWKERSGLSLISDHLQIYILSCLSVRRSGKAGRTPRCLFQQPCWDRAGFASRSSTGSDSCRYRSAASTIPSQPALGTLWHVIIMQICLSSNCAACRDLGASDLQETSTSL